MKKSKHMKNKKQTTMKKSEGQQKPGQGAIDITEDLIKLSANIDYDLQLCFEALTKKGIKHQQALHIMTSQLLSSLSYIYSLLGKINKHETKIKKQNQMSSLYQWVEECF